jgi:CBS domain-containing protein
MKVRELMTGVLMTVHPDTSVLEARQAMVKERIRQLLVTEGRSLVGIITDRDVRLNLSSQATSLFHVGSELPPRLPHRWQGHDPERDHRQA